MLKKCVVVIMLITFSLALTGQAVVKGKYVYVKERYDTKATPIMLACNGKYERLTCVGLYPERNLLEAVIVIKQPVGYKGGLCYKGSKEYVAFYIDYQDGMGFVSAGAPAEVRVHDLKKVKDGPVFYAVRQFFTPKKMLPCSRPQLVKVRAILSWERIPTGPTFTPIWGSVLEEWIQIKPLKLPVIIGTHKPFDAVSEIKLPLLEVMPKQPLSPAVKKYLLKTTVKEKKVKLPAKLQKARKEFKTLISKNINYFGMLSKSKDPKIIKEAILKLPPSKFKNKLLKLKPVTLPCVYPLQFNTDYERLQCVGLYPEEDILEAVIRITRTSGYGTDLCRYGTYEYVAFYIDWGSGVYQHAGTGRVKVHNIPREDGKWLYYAVQTRIKNVKEYLKSCKYENIVKVKAILSWNSDPTPYGPSHVAAWGNVLTKRVQIRPLKDYITKTDITLVNDIPVEHISPGGSNVGLAVNMESTYPYIFDRPFGGIVACKADIVSSAHFYRFRYSDDNGANWVTIKDKRVTMRKNPSIGQKPYKEVAPVDDDGWFSKSAYDQDKGDYESSCLIYWKSYGRNGLHRLVLEVANASKSVIETDEVKVVLDNIGPALYYFSDSETNFPMYGVAIKDADSGGDPLKCDEVTGSNEIRVFGHFYDAYFDDFTLSVLGGNINPVKTIGSGYYDSIAAAGKVYKYEYPGPSISPLPLGGNICNTGIVGANSAGNTGKKIGSLNLCTIPQSPAQVKCAYGIRLYVWDKAIVGSVSGYEFDKYRHSATAYVTFNWDPVGCPGL